MGLRETERTTEHVLARMENSLISLEQMSLDSINITDKLVCSIDEIRSCMDRMKGSTPEEQEKMMDNVGVQLQELLNTAFIVNNVSHELERETVYQRDTVESIRQIVDFLYAMSDDNM